MIDNNKRGELVTSLRREFNLSERVVSDKDILDASEGTFLRSLIELRIELLSLCKRKNIVVN